MNATVVPLPMTRQFQLTPRERQIVRLVAAGCSNVDIARRLGTRPQTVKNQLTILYERLGVRNRAELAVLAVREGLL